VNGGQSSPFRGNPASVTAWSRRSHVKQPVSRIMARVTLLAVPGEAPDPRSPCDGARSPPAIPATRAGKGFSRPYPAPARSVDLADAYGWESGETKWSEDFTLCRAREQRNLCVLDRACSSQPAYVEAGMHDQSIAANVADLRIGIPLRVSC
jgi:hypothetical protein